MSMLLKINKKLSIHSRFKETKEQWKSNSMNDIKLDFELKETVKKLKAFGTAGKIWKEIHRLDNISVNFPYFW